MDSDSDVEIVSAVNQPSASTDPPKPKRATNGRAKPKPAANTRAKKKPAAKPPKLPSLSPVPVPAPKRPEQDQLQSSSLSPVPRKNLKRPAENPGSPSPPAKARESNTGRRRGSASRSWLLSPPPSNSNLKPQQSSNLHNGVPSHSDFALDDDDFQVEGPRSPVSRSMNQPETMDQLGSSPLSSPKLSLQSLDKDDSLDINPSGISPTAKDPTEDDFRLPSEVKDVQREQSTKPLIQSNQPHKSKAIIELLSSPVSICGSPSTSRVPKSNRKDQQSASPGPTGDEAGLNYNPELETNSRGLSFSPIPTRNRSQVLVEDDSSNSLSDLDSILGTSKPSFQPKRSSVRLATRKQTRDDSGSSRNEQSSRAQADRREGSSTVASSLQSYRIDSANQHLRDVNKTALIGDSGKGKGKQAAPTTQNYAGVEDDYACFGNIEDDHDGSSDVRAPDRPASVDSDPPNNPAPKSKALSSRLEKQAKAAEARLAREAKKAAKELGKAAKEQEKIQNRLDREANKLTLNRKETVAEVRMWVPKSLKHSKLHPLTKACEVLVERISTADDCQMNPPGEIDDQSSQGPKGVVRWIRTANKEWDEHKGRFVPLGVGQTKETSEPTVLIVWTGKEVDEMIASGPDELLNRAQAIKSHYPHDQFFIVISGLETLLKAGKRRENAMITHDARARLASQRNQAGFNARPKPGNTSGSLPKNERDKILKELEILKIMTKAFVIRVEDKNEFANWLWEMTLEIGVRPYKSRRQELKSALRLEVSGSKGTNHEDTYIKMLSSLTRVTEAEARGIVARFPTLKSLYTSWERGIENNGVQWAEDMLVGCSKSTSSAAANPGRKIGKVTSKRIFDILYNVSNGNACI